MNVLTDTLHFVIFVYAVSGIICRLVVITTLLQILSAHCLTDPLANAGTLKHSNTIPVTGLGGL
jgi:hypothetical protein